MPKILIIRFSSIGDIVLTTPVVRCIKQQVSDAEIHYLTKNQYVPVLTGNPHIAKIHSIHATIHEVLPMLRAEHFDFVVDLHHNLRSMGVKLSLIRPGASFPKMNIRKWLLVNLKINILPEMHIIDRYFQAVKKLRVNNDFQGLDYFVPEVDQIDISGLPASHRAGYIAFVIGARHGTKILPDNTIIAICKKLTRPVVLLGGPEDLGRGTAIAANAGGHIYNVCGQMNINQSASLIARAEVVITHDTGLMHIAAAFRKRIISVWGNTVPAFGMYPYLPRDSTHLSSIVEVKKLYCRPCSKLGFNACPKKHFRCMNEISPDDILILANG